MGKRSKFVWALAGCPDLNAAIKYGRSGEPAIERSRYGEPKRPPGISRRRWLEFLAANPAIAGDVGMAGTGGMGEFGGMIGGPMMGGGMGMGMGIGMQGIPPGMGGGLGGGMGGGMPMGGMGMGMGAVPVLEEEYEAHARYAGYAPPNGYGGVYGGVPGRGYGGGVPVMAGMMQGGGPAMAPTMNCPACMAGVPANAEMQYPMAGMYGAGAAMDPNGMYGAEAIDPVAAAMLQQQMMGGDGGVPYGMPGGYGFH